MTIHGLTSSRKAPQWAKDEAKSVQRDVNKLASQIKDFDNKVGVDTNLEDGIVKFSKQEFQNDRFSGKFDGEAEIVDGELQLFRLYGENGQSVAGLVKRNGRTQAWAPANNGQLTVVQDNGETRLSHMVEVDPTSTSERVKHYAKNVGQIALDTATTAIPLFGAGITGLRNMFNDSEPFLTGTSMFGNLIGTGGLLVAGLVNSPALAIAGGVSLAAGAVAAGVQAYKESYGPETDAYFRSTTWTSEQTKDA